MKLFPSETGCHPTSGRLSRDQWLREAAAYMKFNDEARSVFVGFIYFNVRYNDAHEWHDGSLYSGNGHSGYKDGFAVDPYYVSAPFSLR